MSQLREVTQGRVLTADDAECRDVHAIDPFTDPRLSLFQRILLTTDGNISGLLLLYGNRPIRARHVKQTISKQASAGRLGCQPGKEVLHRIVLLGPEGLSPYLYAESRFNFSLLSSRIRNALLETTEPVGLLWRAERLEMFREVVDVRTEVNPGVARHLGTSQDAQLYSRTYVIHHLGEPLGEITEKFAVDTLR